MAAQLLSSYTSALKEVLLPYIQDNFPKQTILLDQMKRDAGQQFINDESPKRDIQNTPEINRLSGKSLDSVEGFHLESAGKETKFKI